MSVTPNGDALSLLRDFERYATRWWRLADKAGVIRPFIANPAQRRVLASIDRQRKARRPVRLKVIKCRQCGLSTLVTAMLQHMTQTHAGRNALSLADKQDLPQQWLRRCKTWYEQTPRIVRPAIAASNAMEMYFSGLGSRYFIGSQAGQTPGMGYTLQALHGSEMANWSDPATTLDDIMPAIPQSPETFVVLESTGEIVGDWWHQSVHLSLDGEDEYDVVFIPWYLLGEYRRDDLAETVLDYSPKEQEIVRIAQADGVEIGKAEIAWRRVGLAGEPYHGDEDAFDCKFPTTLEQAFLAPGRTVFLRGQVEAATATVREPIYKADLLHRSGADPYSWILDRGENGSVWIWEEPDPRFHYVIGSDQMWGKVTVSRVANRERDLDYDVAYVECLETRAVCAAMRGRYDLRAWAMMLAALGKWYNWATLAPERNGTESAEVLLPILLGNVAAWRYPSVWVRTDDLSIRGHRIQDYGWYTDTGSKADLVAFAKMATIDGALDWADGRAVSEMRSWIHDDKGRMTSPEGMHDDCLMARMITAYVAHKVRPSTALYVEPTRKVYRFQTLADRLKGSLEEDLHARTG